MGTTPFSELRDAHYAEHPEARERVAVKVARLREELGLGELRERARRTQAEIARELGTAQSGVSRLERQDDTRVSTLRDYVAATGGRLRLVADYPDGQYEIALGADYRPSHAFAVIWQDPDTRQFVHVGRLAASDDDRFAFAYTIDAELHRGFEPFDGMPDLDAAYEADGLFPFLADRVMSVADPAYDDLLDALGLAPEEATPVELLARSAAAAESGDDTVHVVPEPHVRADGSETRRFLASGCRYAAPGTDRDEHTRRIAELDPGDQLDLVDEPANPANPRAVQLRDHDGHQVGWIPDYLLDYVHKRRGEGAIRALVERANGPDAPWHLRILARLEHRPATQPHPTKGNTMGTRKNNKPAVHTVPDGDGWANKRAGAARASKRFDRKADAERAARDTARRERTEHISHRRDGTIGERRSYGNDPHPPKG